MRVPLSWLADLTPLSVKPGDRTGVADLAAALDSLGLVVEGIDRVGEGLDAVVLGRVAEIASIEGADRIRRVVVEAGDESVEVVCGAWNFEVGDVVPLARVGTVLPGGITIERRKMKGVTSNGMICSERELGLGEDHEGIMVVSRPASGDAQPSQLELGEPLGRYLGFGPDVVFDIAVEANRPDCLSMVGIARDLAAHYSLPLVIPEPEIDETGSPSVELASVSVRESRLCRRLTARVINGVAHVPSPPLIQRRLVLAGMRPIDCVVDASNYVMLELGQPTHPYDLDALGGHGLIARAAHPGETLLTLDGTTRILGTRLQRGDDPVTALDCLICNANDLPVGVGGIMGGQSSEISETTTRVLLEAAEFEPVTVGRTARFLGLRTEASVRFERGVDPEGVARASARVCELVIAAAVAAGVPAPTVAPGLLDDRPVRYEPRRLRVRPARVNSLLGTVLEPPAMAALLEPIGYRLLSTGADGALELEVPSWRPDVTLEVDAAEDVARTFGYRAIPRTQRRSPYVGRLDGTQQLRRQVRRLLSGLGAHEAWTSSIVDPDDQARAGVLRQLVRLSNPMVAEQSALRAGLLAGLLGSVRHNAAHRHPWLRLFEVGDVFMPGVVEPARAELDADPDGAATIVLPDERERLAVIFAEQGDDAATAVHAWRVLADALRLVNIEICQDLEGRDPAGVAGLHPARSAYLVVTEGHEAVDPGAGGNGSGLGPDMALGTVGEVDPDVIAAFGLPHERIGWLELNVDRLAAAPRAPQLSQPVSKYPSSDVDLAFVLADEVPAGRLESTLRMAATELCESVQLFDVYRGPGVPPGSRSLAYRLRFCALDHTLTDAEVAQLRQRCIEAAEAALTATLRS